MPELPDLTIYLEALQRRIRDQPLLRLRLASPFVLRTVQPPVTALEGRTVVRLGRVGKRLYWVFDNDHVAVVHLMRLGRFRWSEPGDKPPPRKTLHASFEFESGSLHLVETGSKKRAAIHLLAAADQLEAFDAGGLEVLSAPCDAFATSLRRENRTLKRALTDPRIVAGIGNAYSDEILWQAQLSPTQLTRKLDDAAMQRLHEATQQTLTRFTEAMRAELGDGFPKKVTAFRSDMAVHGRYKQPCPRCDAPVQRIVYADRETNYCARCQTGGKPLADRALSRLLGKDWPKTLDELEELRRPLDPASRPGSGA